jgi:hypothetical protein
MRKLNSLSHFLCDEDKKIHLLGGQRSVPGETDIEGSLEGVLVKKRKTGKGWAEKLLLFRMDLFLREGGFLFDPKRFFF